MDWRGIGLCLATSFLFSNAEATKPPDENPGKFGGHIEGDMILNNSSGAKSGSHAFRSNEKWLWPDGTVYYRLSSTIKTNKTRSSMITEAMSDITQEAPCVNFINIEEDGLNVGSFVDIVTHGDAKLEVSGLGCHSEVGYQGRRQILNLQPDNCFHTPTIKHELMHTLGCVHEHSRPDVAEALDIFIENVKPNLRANFKVEKYDIEDVDKGVFDFNTPYDLFSIMQYPSHAFAFNDSLKTMQAKDPAFRNQFGFSEDFSVIDVVELNLQYRCQMTTQLVFDYTNAFMDIMISRRRMDKITVAKLNQLHQSDQERIVKLEDQSVIDKNKISKLEDQSLTDQERIRKLEDQVQVIQEKRNIDEERITKLESLIKNIILAEPGKTSDSRVQGKTGPRGFPGPPGLMGPNGPSGFPGPKGDRGFNGGPGQKGQRGSPGKNGKPGVQGKTGPRGFSGPPGLTGPNGHSGIPGSKGDRGFNGDPGQKGQRGSPGKHGNPGVQGKTGPRGFIGINGLIGPKGDRGFNGDPGQKGKRGSPGKHGIPGVQGETGPRGFSGPEGQKGQKGSPGRHGIDGLVGKKGQRGSPGRHGIDGLTGQKGQRGSPGKHGIDGLAGQKGKRGSPGRHGIDGLPGSPGPVGPPGYCQLCDYMAKGGRK